MQTKRLFTLLLLASPLVSFPQESIIKTFAEGNNNRKFCLYPSTLRMINIEGDEAFRELVNDVEKLLIYQLDSATSVSGGKTAMLDDYNAHGFEEYASVVGGGQAFYLLGKDKEFVGLTGASHHYLAFYLKGTIGLQKVPVLIETFEDIELLSILIDQFK